MDRGVGGQVCKNADTRKYSLQKLEGGYMDVCKQPCMSKTFIRKTWGGEIKGWSPGWCGSVD